MLPVFYFLRLRSNRRVESSEANQRHESRHPCGWRLSCLWILCNLRRLVLVEVDALEGNSNQALGRSFEVLAYGKLAVLDVFLFQEA